MYLNGKRIVFKGANRHDFCAESGRAIPEEKIRRDLLTMKRNNINAVRTCHYPDSSALYAICDELGLSALVEAHDEREIRSAIAAGARMIGVNNRNLKDFSVDFTNAARLRDLIPPEAVYVAESGVARPADVAALKSIGADAVLMGEVLMRAKDKGAMLAALREASK